MTHKELWDIIQDNDDDYWRVEHKIEVTTRWHTHYRDVFLNRKDLSYLCITYYRGSTEMQEGDEVIVKHYAVEPQERTVTVYVRKQ